jgi:two-component system, response regulator PdtaR
VNDQTEQKILIAEDNRELMLKLATGLRQRGYIVSEAENGEDALTLGLNRRFDLAVIDIRLPGISGIELAQQLKREAKLPFMFLSADGQLEVVQQATAHGALGYLVKPLEISQMIPAIETALARAQDLRKLQHDDEQFNSALAVARRVSMAVGILMERHRADRDSAFTLLRDRARSQRKKVSDVAEDLLKATEFCNFHK